VTSSSTQRPHTLVRGVVLAFTTVALVLSTALIPGSLTTGGYVGLSAYAATGPTITTQPVDQFSAKGGTVEFTVAATGAGSIQIQWQKSPNGADSWANQGSLVTASSNTLTLVASSTTAGYYRALVDDSGGTTTSNTARLRVSESSLFSLAWSPDAIESGRTSRSVVNGGAITLSPPTNPLYVCFRWNINNVSDGSFGIHNAGTSWGPSQQTFTNTTNPPVVEVWVFEVWTHRDVNGDAVNSQPVLADCTRMANDFSPDITATITVYPPGQLSPATQTITGDAGSALSTSALTPNAGWPGTLVFSISPALPAGLSLDTSTGQVTGVPTVAQASTTYTITGKTVVGDVTRWDATSTFTLTVEEQVTPPPSQSLSSQGNTQGRSSSSSSSQPAIHLDLQARPGDKVAGAPVVIGGEGLQSGSPYSLVVRSTPVTVDSGSASTGGTFSKRLLLPSGIAPGVHTITLSAIGSDGSALSLTQTFTVAPNGTFSAMGEVSGQRTAGLAVTGVDESMATSAATLAALLVLMGVLLMVARRRAEGANT